MPVHTAPTFPVECSAGRFVFAVATVRQAIQIRRVAGDIWGGPLPELGSPDSRSPEWTFAWWLAEMQVTAVTVPAGWDWATIDDPNTVLTVWEAYTAARATFREGMGA